MASRFPDDLPELAPSLSSGAPGHLEAIATLRGLEPALRRALGPQTLFRLEITAKSRQLWCARAGFADLLAGVVAWAQEHFASTTTAQPQLRFRLGASPQDLEIGLWENAQGLPSARAHALWSHLAAKLERMGGGMQVEPGAQTGRWRRLWIARVPATMPRDPGLGRLGAWPPPGSC